MDLWRIKQHQGQPGPFKIFRVNSIYQSELCELQIIGFFLIIDYEQWHMCVHHRFLHCVPLAPSYDCCSIHDGRVAVIMLNGK